MRKLYLVRYVFMLAGVIFFLSVHDAITAYTQIGAISSAPTALGNIVLFKCTNARVQVKFCGHDVVKVWCDQDSTFTRTDPGWFTSGSFAVETEALGGPDSVTITNQGAYYEVLTNSLSVRAQTSPFRLSFYDRSGVLLCTDYAASGLSWDTTDDEKRCQKQKQAGENFFGLGQSRKGFNKTGQFVINWNRDLLGSGAPWDLGVDTAGNYYTSIPFVLSTKGYGLFFDNTSRTKFDLGRENPDYWYFCTLNPAAAGEMIYYFIYGPDMKKVVTRYTDLTGKTFFPPRWALGHLQSHWGYTQTDIDYQQNSVSWTYRQKNIPCDAMISDIEWYACQCAPVAWNTGNFPNAPQMIVDLHANGFKFLRIDDPNVSDNQSACTQTYGIGLTNKYYARNAQDQPSKVNWPWGGSSGLVDFFNADAERWWSSLQVPRMNEGLDGMWCDMNEPALSNADMRFFSSSANFLGGLAELHNVYGLAQVRSNYYGMRVYFDSTAKNHSRTFMLCRSGYCGQQKYSLNWSGDITRDWSWLASQVYQGMSEGICGYALWAHDVGGFTGPAGTDSLEARWFEFGALSPISRIHSTAGQSQEPWQFGTTVENIARSYIQMRYRIMPYLYSELAQSVVFKTGLPLMRPLVLEYPNDVATYTLSDEYLLGSSLLVAPVVTSGVTRSVYLPAGAWIDYWDGTAYQGPTTITSYSAPLEKEPVFINAGTILPQYPVVNYDGEKPKDPVTIDVFPNGSTSYTLYEDDGITTAYQQGNYATTLMSGAGSMTGGPAQLTVGASQGTFTGKLSARSYMAIFHYHVKPDSVFLNQAILASYDDTAALLQATQGWSFVQNDRKGTVRVKTPSMPSDQQFTIAINQPATGIRSAPGYPASSLSLKNFGGKVYAYAPFLMDDKMDVSVYSARGERIRHATITPGGRGKFLIWDGCDELGRAESPGYYLLSISYRGTTTEKHIVIGVR